MAVARTGQYNICEEFCKIFNLNFPMCIEYAGDEFLRVKKTKYALQCYNIARVCSEYFVNRNIVFIGFVFSDTISKNCVEIGHIR